MRPTAPEIELLEIPIEDDPTVKLGDAITTVRRIIAMHDIDTIDEANFKSLDRLMKL